MNTINSSIQEALNYSTSQESQELEAKERIARLIKKRRLEPGIKIRIFTTSGKEFGGLLYDIVTYKHMDDETGRIHYKHTINYRTTDESIAAIDIKTIMLLGQWP